MTTPWGIGCQYAPGPYIPATLGWTRNRCATAMFGLEPPDHRPPDHETASLWRPGASAGRTLHPVRMRDVTQDVGHGEACSHHRGHWTVNSRGYTVLVAGMLHAGLSEPRNAIARAWVAPPESVVAPANQQARLRPGYTVWVAAYETPPWVEAWYSAPVKECTGPPA